MNTLYRILPPLSLAIMCAAAPSSVFAQTGVDDDRVSLPEGPGSLEGLGDNVEINANMGAMSYRVPITTPNGRHGMTPNLDLSYSSSAPVGELGIGWSMQLPSIERMSSRGAPRYTSDDLFAADGGTELVEVATKANGDRVYRARFERGFVRYTWVDAGTDGYWIAEYPDGSLGYFGADSSGQLVDSARAGDDALGAAKYLLVEKIDAYGNKISYSWDKLDSNVPLLSDIAWVFTDGQPLYRAQLTYESRPDAVIDCALGYESVLSHRLSRVEIFASNELVREVELTYEDPARTLEMTRLADIKQWGLGGKATGPQDPVVFSFEYQRGLGTGCADCDRPFVVDMGTIQGGVSLTSGKATLIDINGDALPDVLDTSQTSAHRFFLNTLTPDASGGFDHTFSAATESGVADGGTYPLGEKIQTLDLNGDGFSDLVNMTTGAVLLNDPTRADWLAMQDTKDLANLNALDFSNARFVDYDLDRDIDVLVSVGNTTQIMRNDGGDFSTESVDPIGVGFADSNLQLSDLNGDGLNDLVEFVGQGSIRLRVNLGRGKWTDWRSVSGAEVSSSELDLVELEDLDGNGRDDLVIVTATKIKYALNKGDHFAPFAELTQADVDGDLPERGQNTRMLYSDMNANGSEDIVWFDSTGRVRYLELFPQRANLLSKIDNGLGSVQHVTYSTAAQQAALASHAGTPWSRTLRMPLPVVEQVDQYVTLTGSADGGGLHELRTYTYRDGFYDGQEKQLRGFSNVEIYTRGADGEEDAFQQASTTTETYDVGDTNPYAHGLLLSRDLYTDDKLIRATSTTYTECPLQDVPAPNELEAAGKMPIYYICEAGMETRHEEGLPDAAVTTRVEYTYDGWGNITQEYNQGVVDTSGDELYTRRTYTGGTSARWNLSLPVTESTATTVSGPATLTTYYYDGDDFQGLEPGEYEEGFLSRVVIKVDDDKDIEQLRQRRDAFGNSIELIDPNGEVDDATSHRRAYTYDTNGLFISRTTIALDEDRELQRDSRYDYRYQTVASATDWILIEGGEPVSATLESSFVYDGLGRLIKRILPGDQPDTPTAEYAYDLRDPFSTVTISARTTPNGEVDQILHQCIDGRGRVYQQRLQIEQGRYLVSGLTRFNSRGAPVEVFQPYESTSAACDTSAPSGTLSEQRRLDALFRPLSITLPDAAEFGESSMVAFAYEPLITRTFDAEDNDTNSPHASTPTLQRKDGLGRVVSLQRSLGERPLTYQLHYDETNSFSGYTDPKGNRHELSVDLAGRITSVKNPNTGQTTYAYDDAGNVITRTDARGAVTHTRYDGVNRITSQWEDGKEDETRIDWSYDADSDCPLTTCTNTAGRLVGHDFAFGSKRGARRRGYDARGRTIKVVNTWGDFSATQEIEHDNIGRVTSFAYPGGDVHSATYDKADRTTSLAPIIDEISYTSRGLLSEITYTNGASTSRDYDAKMRLRQLTHTDATGEPFNALTYDRDRLGNLLSITDEAMRADAHDHSASFSYDDLYRTIAHESRSSDGSNVSASFMYDDLDNMISRSSHSSGLDLSAIAYSATRPNQLESAGAMTYAYDAAGQLSERAGQTLSWNHRGELERATLPEGAIEYLYAERSQLTGVLTPDGMTLYGDGAYEIRDGVVTSWVRLNGHRVGLTRNTSLMTSIYPDANGDDRIDAADAWLELSSPTSEPTLTAAATPERILGASAARMLAEHTDAATSLQTDHLRSVVAATDEDGEVIGQRAYDMFGSILWEHGEMPAYGFTGQEHMQDGMIRFLWRHLDPQTGRWASFDPNFERLGAAQMSSFGEATTGYAYVGNNPSNVIDPYGLEGGKDNANANKNDNKKSSKKESLGQRIKGTWRGIKDAKRYREQNYKVKAIGYRIDHAQFRNDITTPALKKGQREMIRSLKKEYATAVNKLNANGADRDHAKYRKFQERGTKATIAGVLTFAVGALGFIVYLAMDSADNNQDDTSTSNN